MGQSQSAEVLVSEAPASAPPPSGGEPAPCQPARPRKVFYLVDSLNVGGTEVRAVELASRVNPERYDVPLGCLRARGPLLERLQGSRISVCGVDPERFGQRSEDRAWLMPGANHEKWIIRVGNMHRDVKGHGVLVRAAETVVREFPEVRFLLAGDGERRKSLAEHISRMGLEKHFLFLGCRGDVPRILSCCNLGVLPSQAEGLPNAVLEYLVAGLPTIASQVGGNVEIIQDGKTGLLVPPEDSTALAGAILQMLADPGWAAELGRNGRAYVAAEFNFRRMIEKTDQMYTELLHSRGAE